MVGGHSFPLKNTAFIDICRSKSGAGPLALQGSISSLKNPCGYSGPISKTEIKPPEPDDSLIVKVGWGSG